MDRTGHAGSPLEQGGNEGDERRQPEGSGIEDVPIVVVVLFFVFFRAWVGFEHV